MHYEEIVPQKGSAQRLPVDCEHRQDNERGAPGKPGPGWLSLRRPFQHCGWLGLARHVVLFTQGLGARAEHNYK
jgi:hypothetical protein